LAKDVVILMVPETAQRLRRFRNRLSPALSPDAAVGAGGRPHRRTASGIEKGGVDQLFSVKRIGPQVPHA